MTRTLVSQQETGQSLCLNLDYITEEVKKKTLASELTPKNTRFLE
jgi:hypothetical protein